MIHLESGDFVSFCALDCWGNDFIFIFARLGKARVKGKGLK
jgi:hypothetical protein